MGTIRHETGKQLRLPSAKVAKGLMERDIANLPEELLSVLLHDLRSPLGAIGVLVELISTLSQGDEPADPRQLQLLREAAVKAERMLDDAVEIQSVIRGSSTFTPALTALENIVRTCLEKAGHAPYFQNTQVDYHPNGLGQNLIRIDIEKAETAILCAFEHVVAHINRPAALRIYHSIQSPYINLHIVGDERAMIESHNSLDDRNITLRGRLGTRRLGESRYNLQVCKQVMHLMGGKLEQSFNDANHGITMLFPMASP